MRVIGCRWQPGDFVSKKVCDRLLSRVVATAGWAPLIETAGMCVRFQWEPHAHGPILLGSGHGAVFGRAFARATGADFRCGGAVQAEALASNAGAALVAAYWGPYCAVLHDPKHAALHLVRAPFGAPPLYVAESPGVSVFFTHAEDYVAVADAVEIDWEVLRAFLCEPRVATTRTGLRDVYEVLAGERVTLLAEGSIWGQAWTPRTPRRANSVMDFDSCARSLRRAVLSSAAVWAGASHRIVHRLSGGFDSSVVLGALCAAGAGDIVCVNFFPADTPEGDERAYARLSARSVGAELVEIEVKPQEVDYARLDGVALSARPSQTLLSHASRALADAIMDLGGDLVTSGQGGDQIFHRSRTPLIAVDALHDFRSARDIWQAVEDSARLARMPIWNVLALLARHAWPGHQFDVEEGRLRPSPFSPHAMSAYAAVQAEHPWRIFIEKNTPARALRMRHVMGLDYYAQDDALAARVTRAAILATEPVVDCCLGIAPYIMVKGGQERALARTAFVGLAPEAVINKSRKGSTTRHHHRVLERNLPFMRALLIGGLSVEAGIVDGEALARTLAAPIISARAKSALTNVLLVEIWLRRFQDVRRRAEAMLRAEPEAQPKEPD